MRPILGYGIHPGEWQNSFGVRRGRDSVPVVEMPPDWEPPLDDFDKREMGLPTSDYDHIDPSHYQFNGVQVIQITEHLPFLEGNIVKYAARLGRKPGNDPIQEARKIQWYANRLVEFYEQKKRAVEIEHLEKEEANGG